MSFVKAIVDDSFAVVNPLKLPGQYEDIETGLHYIYLIFYQNPFRIAFMDTQKWLWLSAKGLSFASIGGIIYVLFCMKGQ